MISCFGICFLDLFRSRNDEKWEVPFEFSFPVDNLSKLNVDPFQFYFDCQLLNSQQQQQQKQFSQQLPQQLQTNSLYHQQMNDDDECYFVDDNDIEQISQQTPHCVDCNNSLTVSTSNSSMTLSNIDNNSNVINEPSQSFFINKNTIDINTSNTTSNTESYPISTTNFTTLSTTTTTNLTMTSPNHSMTTFPNQHFHDIFHNFHMNKHFSNKLYDYNISSNVTFQRRNYRKPKSFLVKALKDYVQYKHTTQKSIAHQIGIRLISCLQNSDHLFICDF